MKRKSRSRSIRRTMAILLASAILWQGSAVGSTSIDGGRVALVIGNNDYEQIRGLASALIDAGNVADALERLGFSVQRVENASRNDMVDALGGLANSVREAEIVIVYYAGQGSLAEGQSILIPVDLEADSVADLPQDGVSLQQVRTAIQHTCALRLIIVDADGASDPFKPRMRAIGTTRSLAVAPELPEHCGEEFVAFASREGTHSFDGTPEENSPYTSALLRYLEVPGLEVGMMFRKVRDAVLVSTGRQQEPVTYGALPGRNIFLLPVEPLQSEVP